MRRETDVVMKGGGLLMIAVALWLGGCAGSPSAPNSESGMRQQLLDMGAAEQRYRPQIESLQNSTEYSAVDQQTLTDLIGRQSALDEQNVNLLEDIVQRYGWPRRSQVGRRASDAAFRVLSHADPTVQAQFLPLLRTAVKQGEAPRAQLNALTASLRNAGHGQP